MGKLSKVSEQSLSKYDPHKGVKKIAVLEMAEKHYAKAKDATKLISAIRDKLEAQAEFVLWWDTQVEKSKGAAEPRRNGSVTALVAGKDGLPDRMTLSRWRAKLNDPDKFEATFESVCAKYPKLLEFVKGAHVEHNSGENEWYTPAEYIEAARLMMGAIDLDPATSLAANEIVKAGQIFTADDSGLTESWDGCVWLNPPYAQPLISQFCDKLADSVRAGSVSAACVLVNNATETQWFRALVDVAAAICFPSGRIRFWSPGKESAAPLQGQAVIYVGSDVDRFIQAFGSFGFVTQIVSRDARAA
jgi:ParB family chromosome partitioning protein